MHLPGDLADSQGLCSAHIHSEQVYCMTEEHSWKLEERLWQVAVDE